MNRKDNLRILFNVDSDDGFGLFYQWAFWVVNITQLILCLLYVYGLEAGWHLPEGARTIWRVNFIMCGVIIPTRIMIGIRTLIILEESEWEHIKKHECSGHLDDDDIQRIDEYFEEQRKREG